MGIRYANKKVFGRFNSFHDAESEIPTIYQAGEQVDLHAEFVALREESAVMRVHAKVGDTVMAQAEQVFVFNAVPFDNPSDSARVEAAEGAELARLWAHFDPEVWTS